MVNSKKPLTKEFSLLHPISMGGIHGGDGYSFQDRYIVCHIPKWLSDPKFLKMMGEATGDVDVVYLEGRKHLYDHIQVKDHHVSPSAFKEVIQGFLKADEGTKRVYRHFVLAAPSVSQEIKSLSKSLERYREGKKLYAADKKALKSTEAEIKKLIEKYEFKKYFHFFVEKLGFEIGAFDFNDNGTCKQMFISRLLEHPKYKKHLADLLNPAYSVLIDQVLAHKGKVLDQKKLYEFINNSLTNPAKQSKTNVMYLHNWTVEKYEPKASITIDWAHLFNRSTRLVPEPDIWNGKLIPELFKVKKDLATKTTNRHIIFRGRCALSSAISLGMTFPEIGNWTFELNQPPETKPWRSDAEKIKNYKIKHELLDPASIGISVDPSENVFIFNITGTALEEVINYLKSNSIAVNKIILIQPSKEPGNLSIQSDSEAVSLANASKEIIRKYKSNKAHLFFFGPLGLGIFLGQKLTSVGNIQLYEFQDPGYKPSCLFKT